MISKIKRREDNRVITMRTGFKEFHQFMVALPQVYTGKAGMKSERVVRIRAGMVLRE